MSALILVVCLVSVHNTWVEWKAHAVLVAHAGRVGGGHEELRAVGVSTFLADAVMWLALVVAWIALTEWLWRVRVNSDRISDRIIRQITTWQTRTPLTLRQTAAPEQELTPPRSRSRPR